MIEFPSRPLRRPPKDSVEMLSDHARVTEEETFGRIQSIAERVSDRTDEIEFKSTGVDEEVKIVNKLGFTPTRMIPCREKYPYTIGWSRDSLADKDFIYVRTSAPRGTVFCARFDP